MINTEAFLYGKSGCEGDGVKGGMWGKTWFYAETPGASMA